MQRQRAERPSGEAAAGARMTTRTLGILLLLMAPAALAYFAGWNEAAHYVGLGALLAVQLVLFARPVAAFAILLPMVYAGAAITAQATDGVITLIVAIAAAVGAASSQGLHRGLVALLAAALIGSFEPGATGTVARRAAFLLAGSSYGFVLAVTVLARLRLTTPSVPAQSALGYAVLLAMVTLAAWYAARLADFAHPWWLPLAIVAISDPVAEGGARHALVRAVLAATAAMTLVYVTDAFDAPLVRGMMLVATLLVALAAGARRYEILAVLLAPVLVLISSHGMVHEPPLEYLRIALPAFAAALAVTCLGHWLFWILRAGAGRVPA